MALLSFTKKADYGLVILTALAEKGKGVKVSLGDLVAAKKVPKAFGAQIGRALVEAGIIGSKEGRGGGYFLAKDPEKISLKKVLTAIEGEVAIVACAIHGHRCPMEKVCSQRGFMQKFTKEIEGILESYKVSDLIKKNR